MLGLARILWGYRNDLDLDQRWWHRLFKVLFAVAALTALATVALIASNYRPGANESNARILIDVVTFTDTHKELKNTLPAFLALDGRTGQRMSDGGIYEYYPGRFDKSDCRYIDPSKQSDPKDYIDVPIPSDFELVGQGVPNAPGGEILDGYCTFQIGIVIPFGRDLVKWKYRPQMYLSPLLIGLAVVAVCALILMNLYYRGLVYVVCGPRRV